MSENRDIPPPLSPEQITLIGTSFAHALQGKAKLAARVYERFFELEPDTRPLFHSDLTTQRDKITTALSVLVRAMASDRDLAMRAEALARSHLKFNLRPEQLHHMAQAILGALSDCLGDRLTPEMDAAWRAAYARFLPFFIAAQLRLSADLEKPAPD